MTNMPLILLNIHTKLRILPILNFGREFREFKWQRNTFFLLTTPIPNNYLLMENYHEMMYLVFIV